LQRVGVNDNFFELGGDSILSIQTIARAREAGLHLTPKDLFQHQTIAKLAVVAKSSATFQAEQGLVTGPVPLTPIQHWFFEHQLTEPHYFNQALLLELRQAIDPALLADAVRHLVLHHDALRLRFEQSESGWRQYHADAGEEITFTILDLSTAPEGEQRAAIEAAAAEEQTKLNLTTGPVLRVIYFDLDKTEIHSEFQAQIACHAAYLRQFPGAKVTLEGNADERGTRDYNQGLGERRGNSVSSAVAAAGASTSQLNVVSYGEEKPVCREHNEECWQKNRRVEIVYTSKQ